MGQRKIRKACDCCGEYPSVVMYRGKPFCADCSKMNLDYYIEGPDYDEREGDTRKPAHIDSNGLPHYN